MKKGYTYLLALVLGVVLLMAAGCSNGNDDNTPAGNMSTDNIQQDDGSTSDAPGADDSSSIDSGASQDSGALSSDAAEGSDASGGDTTDSSDGDAVASPSASASVSP